MVNTYAHTDIYSLTSILYYVNINKYIYLYEYTHTYVYILELTKHVFVVSLSQF